MKVLKIFLKLGNVGTRSKRPTEPWICMTRKSLLAAVRSDNTDKEFQNCERNPPSHTRDMPVLLTTNFSAEASSVGEERMRTERTQIKQLPGNSVADKSALQT